MASFERMAASSQPDLRLIGRLAVAQKICLTVIFVIAGGVLAGWLLPGAATLLPPGWSLMKASTALAALAAAASMALSQPRASHRRLRLARLSAGLVILVGGLSLVEHLTGRDTGIVTLLATASVGVKPGLMSLQTTTFYLLFGVTQLVSTASKSLLSHVVDSLTMALVVVALVVLAGYCFGATQLFGQSEVTRTSPQSLVCLGLLAFVRMSRRAEYGYFSVLLGIGIGSRFARVVLPLSIVLPFLFTFWSAYSANVGLLSAPYAAALTATASALLFFGLVLVMARRINDLERDLRDMSLTDELTQVYNRRGFQLLGDQAMREARRNREPLTVLFFDLDGLKKANDSFGHAVGSQFVVDVADLLRATFRGADIAARIGGDEFAVVFHNSAAEAQQALRRLEEATATANQRLGRPYVISYSVGEATTEPGDDSSFGDLVVRADALMYQRKRIKKAEAAQPAGPPTERPLQHGPALG